MNRTFLVGVFLAFAAIGSHASPVAPEDFYVRANLGHARASDFFLAVDDSERAWGLNFGWRFLPWLAAEVGYNRFGEFYRDYCGADACAFVVYPFPDFSSREFGVAARLPLGESGLSARARAGAHNWETGVGGSRTDPYFGVGLGYQFNERFDLGLNFDRYQANSVDISPVLDPFIPGDVDLDRVGLSLEFSF